MFLALMGIGFEGANLEHAERFSRQFEAAGDHESAHLVMRPAKWPLDTQILQTLL